MSTDSSASRLEALDAIAKDAAALVMALAQGDVESASDAAATLGVLLEEAGYLRVHRVQ